MKKQLFIIIPLLCLVATGCSFKSIFNIKTKRNVLPQAQNAEVNNPFITNSSKHFGVDGIGTKSIWKIAEIRDGASGSNGLSWGGVEPKPPVNGVHRYASDNNLRPILIALNKTGRKLQLNLRLTGDWAR